MKVASKGQPFLLAAFKALLLNIALIKIEV